MSSEIPRGEKAIDKQSLKDLAVIYRDQFKKPHFPSRFCGYVSSMVEGLGFKIVDGNFMLDKPMNRGKRYGHAWCVDIEGNIIDLTLTQFNKGLEQPVRKGILIIKPDDPLYRKFEPHPVLV